MTPSATNLLTFSANDLATLFGVERQTIYRMRAEGRLPNGFLLGKRVRRWSLMELTNHSDDLKLALSPFWLGPKPSNDNEPG